MTRGRVLMAYFPQNAPFISNNPLDSVGTSGAPEPGYGFPVSSIKYLYLIGVPAPNNVTQVTISSMAVKNTGSV